MQYPFHWKALGIVRDGLRESCVVHIEDTLGPERLDDVVLDLDAPALAAWLTDPDAR